MNKLLTLKTLLIGLFVMSISGVIFGLVSPQPATAQGLTDSQVSARAEALCGKGAVGSSDAACRNGFRRGFNSETIGTACNSRADYNEAEKSGCRKGHAEGTRLKSASGSTTGSSGAPSSLLGSHSGTHQCGAGDQAFKTKFNFGCRGTGTALFDVLFAIIRFLTYGVGIMVVIAIILAGIKYSTSEGNPEATMAAKTQIQNAIIALLLYLFSFALLNFLVPGGLFL